MRLVKQTVSCALTPLEGYLIRHAARRFANASYVEADLAELVSGLELSSLQVDTLVHRSAFGVC